MTRCHLSAAVLATAVSLSACSTMSGLSGASHYACQAPDGVACDSVSGTYANAVQGALPSQRAAARTQSPSPGKAFTENRTGPGFAPIATPLRAAPRVLRLWFKPWEDADGDLYDQGYVYVQIDTGRWLIDHAQRSIRETYRPLRPPPAPQPERTEPEPPAAPFAPISVPPEGAP